MAVENTLAYYVTATIFIVQVGFYLRMWLFGQKELDLPTPRSHTAAQCTHTPKNIFASIKRVKLVEITFL